MAARTDSAALYMREKHYFERNARRTATRSEASGASRCCRVQTNGSSRHRGVLRERVCRDCVHERLVCVFVDLWGRVVLFLCSGLK